MKQTNDKCFIDTNILIYCYTDTEPEKKRKALTVAEMPDSHISTQVLTEFANTLKRKFSITSDGIILALKEVRKNFKVFVNKPDTIEYACSISEKYKFSFYDSLIIAAALHSDCKILYSEDMQHKQIIKQKLKIVNPLL